MKKTVLIALLVVLALVASASLVSANPGDLVSYWPFDEGTGTTAEDVVGGNNGTIVGATWVDGNFGKALSFDGNDRVVVPDSTSLEPVNVTVAAWVQAPSSPGPYQYIVGKGASGCTAASYALYTAGGGLSFYISNGSSYVLSPNGGASVWDGKWHHVVGTYDGSHVRLYVDGSQIGTGTSTSMAIGYGLSPTDDFFVGAYGGCNLPFVGLIDEVGIWNHALTLEEIAALVYPLVSPVVEVEIDIKPGSDPNCFNNDGHGVIPVAILGSETFDVTLIDPSTVTLEGLGVRVKGKSDKLLAHYDDVSGPAGVPDSYIDLVVQIEDGDGVWSAGTTLATVTGELFDGTPIMGQDFVCIVQ